MNAAKEARYRAARPLYRLRDRSEGGPAEVFAGRLADGRLALMGAYGDELVCVAFGPDGAFGEVLARPLSLPARGGERADAEGSPPGVEPWLPQAEAWQGELGWSAGPIDVQPFLLWDRQIYLADYPGWAIRYRADPIVVRDPEERAQVQQQVREWEESGAFVFWWGKDYFMSKDGEAVST